ncbi:DNA topoisomerase 2 [Artemisia annua]|uniref:DNA topoisomerase (ATP-hydrolyzing) n=1 Tax=Artemisia annua TaxID=35608 RepID=A0A2U1ND50_ARTAN|nr:DNA topoisomerase 2 [Artemisia annua]
MATPQNDPPMERCEWIWDWEEKKMRKRSIKFVPSLYNIYEKVLVKAADKQKVKEIKVSIDVKNAIISVWNNGQRVDAHKKDEYWTKQAIRYSSQFTIETAHGSKRSKKVLETVFRREKDACKSDERAYDDRVEEVKARIEHRHGIIMELKKLGIHPVLKKYLME